MFYLTVSQFSFSILHFCLSSTITFQHGRASMLLMWSLILIIRFLRFFVFVRVFFLNLTTPQMLPFACIQVRFCWLPFFALKFLWILEFCFDFMLFIFDTTWTQPAYLVAVFLFQCLSSFLFLAASSFDPGYPAHEQSSTWICLFGLFWYFTLIRPVSQSTFFSPLELLENPFPNQGFIWKVYITFWCFISRLRTSWQFKPQQFRALFFG